MSRDIFGDSWRGFDYNLCVRFRIGQHRAVGHRCAAKRHAAQLLGHHHRSSWLGLELVFVRWLMSITEYACSLVRTVVFLIDRKDSKLSDYLYI